MAITLTGANQQTEWWEIGPFPKGTCFQLLGTFDTAVGIRYSNSPLFVKPSSAYTTSSATYSSSAETGIRKFPAGLAKYVAFFSSGSWTSGTVCAPSFSPSEDADGQMVTPSPQPSGSP